VKKLPILLASAFLLVSCAETLALLGPATGVSNGNIVNSSLKSAVSFGVKKQTGKTPMQHVLAYAEEKNPNKKKEKCISFIEKTNSETCMIAKKQISLVQSTISKKISDTRTKIKEKTQTVIAKPIQDKIEVDSFVKSKKLTKEFFLTLKTKIKKYDNRWLDRIEKSSLHR
jgi:hypothetical protein|tara:strand:- start:395 stop:907 length:513 start_codon:yes stop_codon:yes gene_type:complete